jgi:hypothetical protein
MRHFSINKMESKKIKPGGRKKTGHDFEQLIAWIQKSVHKSAKIGVNEKLKDIDTGKQRQIDITIRLSDGPTEFLGIVEVRDRSRPVGAPYIEEVSGKRRSVKADAAFLVSRSGFTKTAITKAKQLGIRALTYEEAQTANWSKWLQNFNFLVLQRKYDESIIHFFEYGTDERVSISPKDIEKIREDKTSKIILDEHGMPISSVPDILNRIINVLGEEPYKNIPTDGTRKRCKFLFQGKFEPSIWLSAENGTMRQIGKIGIETELYWECKKYPVRLMRYKEAGSTKSIAELALTDIEISKKKYRIELLAPWAGEYIPAGSTLSLRSTPLKDSSEK